MDVQLIHFNRPETALRCSELWLSAGARRVVIWDNASIPGALAALDRAIGQRTDLVIRRLPENLGFAGAAAAAVEHLSESDCDSVLIAAHDAEPASGAVRHLADAISHTPSLGVLFPTGSGSVFEAWHAVRGGRRVASGGESRADLVDCAYADAAAFILTRKAVEAGVRPDPALFCYWEECDLGLQARRLGLRVVSATRAIVRNGEVATSFTVPGCVAYLQARNSVYLARKHSSRPFQLLRGLALAILSTIRALDPRPPHFSLDPLPRLRGVAAGLLSRMGPPPCALPSGSRPRRALR